MNPLYERNAESGVWQRPDGGRIDYSDGSDSEARLLDFVRSVRDPGVLSDEMAAGISDWPAEYHRSRSRHCLLRPLGVNAGDRVLELGCGCGALTRFLGECGAHVDAVEGSPLRAQIAAARCRDLPSIAIYQDDLARFSSGTPYDWVLLVGVLEYAPVYSVEPDPVRHYLTHAATFLAPAGRLVLAIENKLGLKYFNGCSEDHVGRPYYGIQSLYGDKQPITFGRKELAAHLAAAGLAAARFYYPFPDYKLPATILADAALAVPDLHAHDLLPWVASRDYTAPTSRAFSEALAWQAVGANGLLSELANSFLVVASRMAQPPLHDANVLAWHFNVQCKRRLATQTICTRTPEGLLAEQTRLAGSNHEVVLHVGPFALSHRVVVAQRAEPIPCPLEYLRAQARGDDFASRIAPLAPWFRFLCSVSMGIPSKNVETTPLPLRRITIDGSFFDCTPFHGHRVGGAFVPRKTEWSAECPIPLGWVLSRSIRALQELLPAPNSGTDPAVICAILRALIGQEARSAFVDESDVETWLQLERAFQSCLQ